MMNHVYAEPVELIVPAHPQHLRLIRLVVASLAADAGCDVDRIEDLRIAADEVVSMLMEAGTGRITVELSVAEGTLSLRASGRSTGTSQILSLDPLSEQIVSVIVDDVRITAHDGLMTAAWRAGVGPTAHARP